MMKTSTATIFILLAMATYQQQFAFAVPAIYTSERYQMPSRKFVPVVGSALPFAMLSDLSLATRSNTPTLRESLFERPHISVERAPQNDAEALAAIQGASSTRTARHIRVYRIADVDAMDRAINGHIRIDQDVFMDAAPQNR